MLVVTSPVAGAVAAASGGFNAHSGVLAITGSFAWMCMVALITGTGVIRLRGRSHWEEREVTPRLWSRMTSPSRSPGSRACFTRMYRRRLILGELKRQETVLDPYLLIEHNGECACLGIWENKQVIACAE